MQRHVHGCARGAGGGGRGVSARAGRRWGVESGGEPREGRGRALRGEKRGNLAVSAARLEWCGWCGVSRAAAAALVCSDADPECWFSSRRMVPTESRAAGDPFLPGGMAARPTSQQHAPCSCPCPYRAFSLPLPGPALMVACHPHSLVWLNPRRRRLPRRAPSPSFVPVHCLETCPHQTRNATPENPKI